MWVSMSRAWEPLFGGLAELEEGSEGTRPGRLVGRAPGVLNQSYQEAACEQTGQAWEMPHKAPSWGKPASRWLARNGTGYRGVVIIWALTEGGCELQKHNQGVSYAEPSPFPQALRLGFECKWFSWEAMPESPAGSGE